MIQLLDYVCIYARMSIRFGLSMFDSSSDISSYACQSYDRIFVDHDKPEFELHLIS
jgi:hypothetical protein